MTMTKLEAVNIALDAIGEEAVNSLASATADAESAERMLDEAKREVLSQGWGFNTRTIYLTLDVDGRFVVPGNALSVVTTGPHALFDVVVDGGYLLNKYTNSTVWGSPNKIQVEIVYDRDFEVLPYTLSNYIARYNAVRFQKRALGSISRNSLAYQDLMDAKAIALADDNIKRGDSMIWGNSGSAEAMYRRNRFTGR